MTVQSRRVCVDAAEKMFAMTARNSSRSIHSGGVTLVSWFGFRASVEAPSTQDSRVMNFGCC